MSVRIGGSFVYCKPFQVQYFVFEVHHTYRLQLQSFLLLFTRCPVCCQESDVKVLKKPQSTDNCQRRSPSGLIFIGLPLWPCGLTTGRGACGPGFAPHMG